MELGRGVRRLPPLLACRVTSTTTVVPGHTDRTAWSRLLYSLVTLTVLYCIVIRSVGECEAAGLGVVGGGNPVEGEGGAR